MSFLLRPLQLTEDALQTVGYGHIAKVIIRKTGLDD